MKTAKSIRWTINAAALEFGVGTKAVSHGLKAASISPGKDGKFSTVEIAEAIFDSEHKQRVRLTKEQADAKSKQNAITDREMVPVTELAKRMGVPLLAMRKRILNDENLSKNTQTELLLDLQELYTCIFRDSELQRPGAIVAMKAAEKEES